MKKVWWILVPVVIIGAYLWKAQVSKIAIPSPTPVASVQNTVSLSIDYGNGQEAINYQSNFTGNQTALDLLTTLTKTNNVPLTVKKYSFGTLVESVNNVKNTTALAWIYFVNGQSASIGADQYIVKAGDKIEWKYIKPSF
jgi:hypothetical protein